MHQQKRPEQSLVIFVWFARHVNVKGDEQCRPALLHVNSRQSWVHSLVHVSQPGVHVLLAICITCLLAMSVHQPCFCPGRLPVCDSHTQRSLSICLLPLIPVHEKVQS